MTAVSVLALMTPGNVLAADHVVRVVSDVRSRCRTESASTPMNTSRTTGCPCPRSSYRRRIANRVRSVLGQHESFPPTAMRLSSSTCLGTARRGDVEFVWRQGSSRQRDAASGRRRGRSRLCVGGISGVSSARSINFSPSSSPDRRREAIFPTPAFGAYRDVTWAGWNTDAGCIPPLSGG